MNRSVKGLIGYAIVTTNGEPGKVYCPDFCIQNLLLILK